MFKSLGIDYVVCPEKIAAKEITNLINVTAATEIFDFTDKHLVPDAHTADPGCESVLGKNLNQIAGKTRVELQGSGPSPQKPSYQGVMMFSWKTIWLMW
jgi:Trk K+ transport system NAD-binding subunit